MSWDVVISGAGIIGVSLALELRHRGAQVLVLDRAEPGRESSSAAAGMLADLDPETPEELRPLARKSAAMYPAFVAGIESDSGIKVDFRSGAIALFERERNLPGHRPLSPTELKHREPALDARGCSAYLIDSENSVDPELLMQAVLEAANRAGVEIRAHAEVKQISSKGVEVEVATGEGRFVGKAVVNCQGAWAGAPVRPRKGQMLYLQPRRAPLLNHVLRAPGVYLVPRSSGRILVGATVEDVGFDKTALPDTIDRLHRAAAQFVPELAEAEIVASWAGLRPGTPDDLPILGSADKPGVWIAGGHFRNGILLAPITAKVMADLVGRKAATLDLSAFSPSRFTPVAAAL